MTRQEQTELAVQLAHSVPLPAWLEKIIFGTYRVWLRVAGHRE
jgi:hypothetical protein